jgi:hypothetical protein
MTIVLEYCVLKTDTTTHAWAIEDVCTACAALSILGMLERAEDR